MDRYSNRTFGSGFDAGNEFDLAEQFSDNVFDNQGNLTVGDRISSCSVRPTQAERSRCIENMLHGSEEDVQVHRVLGKEKAPSQQAKTIAPQPFRDVAGIVLDSSKKKFDAVVMHDGSVRSLPTPVRAPDVNAGADDAQIMSENRMRQLVHAQNKRPAADEDEDEEEPAATEDDENETQVEQARDDDVPQAPPLHMARPIAGGSLPVVTPATEQDARELRQQVKHAQPLSHDQHTNFVQELDTATAAHNKREQTIADAIGVPQAPPQALPQVPKVQQRPSADMLQAGASRLRRVVPSSQFEPTITLSDHDKLMEAVRARAAQRATHPNDHYLIKSGSDMIPATRPKPSESHDEMFDALRQQVLARRAAVQQEEPNEEDEWAETVNGSREDYGGGGGDQWMCDGRRYRVLPVVGVSGRGEDDDEGEADVERLEWALRRGGHVLADMHKMGVMIPDELFALVNRAYTAKFHVPGTQDEWWEPEADAFEHLLELVHTFNKNKSQVAQKKRLETIWAFILAMPDDASSSGERSAKVVKAYYIDQGEGVFMPKHAHLASIKPRMSIRPRHR